MKYYLHDSNSFNDEKITELFIHFGYEGLGLFYTLLEKIALQEKPVKTEILKHQLKVGKKLNRCWAFMESLELISTINGETFNDNILKFSKNYQIKKEKTRNKVKEWRDKQHIADNVTGYNDDSNTPKVKESKVKESKGKDYFKEGNWRKSFAFYQKQLSEAHQRLISNPEFISTQERLNPNVDIKLSIEKSIINYWSTEGGWKNKKSKKTKDIDWKATLTNAIGMNKVYKQNERHQQSIGRENQPEFDNSRFKTHGKNN